MLNQPRKLTPRSASTSAMTVRERQLTTCPVWNTIRPKLLFILEEGRRQREADAFQLKWVKRREQLQAHYEQFLLEDRASIKTRTLPSPDDAVELPCMKEIMTGEEPDVDLTQEEFLAIREIMLSEAEEYRARVQRELAKKLADASTAKSVASSTLPPRKRRRLPGASSVAKGKQRASAADDSDDAGMDSDEVSKLLENPNSVFRCSPGWMDRDKCKSQVFMSYIGLLEHRQVEHGTWNNADTFVTKPGYGDLFDAQFARRLLSSLRLEEGTTHSELDVIVRSGRPHCSCGKDPIPNFESEPKPAILGRLVRLFFIVMTCRVDITCPCGLPDSTSGAGIPPTVLDKGVGAFVSTYCQAFSHSMVHVLSYSRQADPAENSNEHYITFTPFAVPDAAVVSSKVPSGDIAV